MSSSSVSAVWVVDAQVEGDAAWRALVPNFAVELFANGAQVLERLTGASKPDLLVLARCLQGPGAVEICTRVRARFDEVQLPILVIHPTTTEREAGANDCVRARDLAEDMLARVTTLCRVSRLSAERCELLRASRDALQRAEIASRATDEFLAMVSHELRTPLNAISGYATLLRGGKVPPNRVEEAFDTIERNVRAQTRLIDDLLDVSRMAAGKLSLTLRPINLLDVVRRAIAQSRPAAARRNIELCCEAPPLGLASLADAERLQQVVEKLLSNAVKFTPADGHVTVTLAEGERGNTLVVADDGPGIAPSMLPHVFESFTQAEPTTTRSHGGLGLGLSIVRHVIELHGGSVSVGSRESGSGTVFTVELPRTLPVASTSGEEPPNATAALPCLSGLRVLLVEDDADGREVIASLLRNQGAAVDSVSSARDALRALDSAVPDVLVSDLGMPEEDGLSLLRKVRARDSSAGGVVPALALTAFARREDREQSLLAGFNDYLTKPVESAALVRAVAGLSGRRAESPTLSP